MSKLGNEMLEYRAKNNLTQEQLAKMLDIQRRSVCQIELGKQNPRKTLVMRFELLKKGEL
ncbi:MAG: helix-turn-helix domain-containing protein [Lachnospiraceae bacterium]|nr:helix-turn-helix domain-containing protein [Lachnospiraceae bacterium]